MQKWVVKTESLTAAFYNTHLFYKEIKQNTRLPPAKPLRGRTLPVPFPSGADDAFALSVNIIKRTGNNHRSLSPERIFNYRLVRHAELLKTYLPSYQVN
jgi:hypothetical protein